MTPTTLTRGSPKAATLKSAAVRGRSSQKLRRIASGREDALALIVNGKMAITVMRVLLAMPYKGRTKALRICEEAQVNGALLLHELTPAQRLRLYDAVVGISAAAVSSDPRRLTLHPDSLEATFFGRTKKLGPAEFRLLEYLAKLDGEVVTLQTIVDNVWPPGRGPNVTTVRTHISHIRAKLGNGLIVSVHGFGIYVPAEVVGRVAA